MSVLDLSGVLVLGREPVINRQHTAAARSRQVRRHTPVTYHRTRNITTAMQIQDCAVARIGRCNPLCRNAIRINRFSADAVEVLKPRTHHVGAHSPFFQ